MILLKKNEIKSFFQVDCILAIFKINKNPQIAFSNRETAGGCQRVKGEKKNKNPINKREKLLKNSCGPLHEKLAHTNTDTKSVSHIYQL